ncbi:A/G-specific adenine glycosylase [Marixanthomonas spongiae]|uniref:Adenine DNA glycosylase n=1 Tax=Marixanthomonas spongiae TaxID=2174845 RepID=A0A2U0I8G8_9FLAO|nr:A/G-specific adenine glycosylase [Marixanthomonas spongiae]PVW17402.1 A/G-specific adenine glycosylase [Marixanthomonas spongiae]
MPENTTFFRNKLITWYLENKRELPWRKTKDPYRIWLSEIMLQQTRVEQGLPYYLKFVDAFPTVFHLAEAPQKTVLKLWQGLGYYSRARNLHAAAHYISETLKGEFPSNYKDLLNLKGVGDYTASAIASICYNEPQAVVDGNVYRVLSRVFGVETPINSTAGKKEFKQLAQQLIDAEQPGTYNQALMEFGARYCVPRNPNCEACIFNNRCEAYKKNLVSALPVKLKKRKVKKRYFNYMVVLSEGKRTLLNQRTGKGIWQQLYEFPLIESGKEVSEKELKKLEGFKLFSEEVNIEDMVLYNETSVVHKLSHQHLFARFWIVAVSEIQNTGIPFSEIQNYPVPVLLQNFISDFSVFKN